jgi:hypothetical protein
MTSERKMVLVLLILLGMAVFARMIGEETAGASWINRVVWHAFLFAVPIALAGLLLAGKRWTLMAGVMYGTVGLALDIATVVQDLTRSDAQQTVIMSGITGLLNFLLILIGGSGFLDVSSAASLPADRPPSPPSHSAR